MSTDGSFRNFNWGYGWNVLLWITSAFSIISLIDRGGWIQLAGYLKDWVSAWRFFVADVVSVLFGWLKWRWIEVDQLEGQILVVATAFASAVVRTATSDTLVRMVATPLLVLPFVLSSALLPGIAGLIGSVLLLFAWMLWALVPVKFRKAAAPDLEPDAVGQEVLIVLGLVALLILANFLIFHSS